MIEITNLKVFNLEGSFRGMRQPFKTTSKTDSDFGIEQEEYFYSTQDEFIYDNYEIKSDEESEEILEYFNKNSQLEYDNEAVLYALIGPNDLKLAQKLIAAGSPHDKFMRQIFVSMDINAPLYW